MIMYRLHFFHILAREILSLSAQMNLSIRRFSMKSTTGQGDRAIGSREREELIKHGCALRREAMQGAVRKAWHVMISPFAGPVVKVDDTDFTKAVKETAPEG